jgi:uncharacterized protein (DUF58 family)
MRTSGMLSPRGSGALGGGLGTLLVGFFSLNLLVLVVGAAFTGFVLTALVWFSLSMRGFGPADFVYERYENSSEVIVGDLGSMGLRLENRGRSGFFAEIFDSHPDSLEIVAGSPRLVTWWSPQSEQRLVYAFRPRRRGAFLLGPTVVIAHEPFGFAFRVTTVENPWPVDVALRVPLLAAGPSTFDTDHRIEGRINLPMRGMGTEFRSLREYQDSDDIRAVAWKRSTMGRLYVREFERETPQDVVPVIDTGWRMGAGEPGKTALDRAVETSSLVVRYALLRADRVGLLLWSHQLELYVPVGRGTDLAATLRRGLTEARTGPGTFDAAGAFRYLDSKLTKPAHLLVFAAPPRWTERDTEAYMALTRHGHQVYFFLPNLTEMYSPLEEEISQRVAALVDAPEKVRRSQLVDALGALGAPVFGFDRTGPTETMIDLAAEVRAYRGRA